MNNTIILNADKKAVLADLPVLSATNAAKIEMVSESIVEIVVLMRKAEKLRGLVWSSLTINEAPKIKKPRIAALMIVFHILDAG